MTVCTASIFQWDYGKGEIGNAIVLASDRMYTASDMEIEYESSRTKLANIDSHHVVMVSGDLSLNSLILNNLVHWRAAVDQSNTLQIAEQLGQIVAAVAFWYSSRIVLNTLGIFPEEVLSDARGLERYGLPEAVVMRLAEQLQEEKINVEAIVAGCDGKLASLLHVDHRGRVSMHNDIGFLSIGSGGIHSSAYFMQLPYKWHVGFPSALVSTFFAKKRAEIGPGVGQTTDMAFINAIGFAAIEPEDLRSLQKLHADEKRRISRMHQSHANRFTKDAKRRYEREQAKNPSRLEAPIEVDRRDTSK